MGSGWRVVAAMCGMCWCRMVCTEKAFDVGQSPEVTATATETGRWQRVVVRRGRGLQHTGHNIPVPAPAPTNRPYAGSTLPCMDACIHACAHHSIDHCAADELDIAARGDLRRTCGEEARVRRGARMERESHTGSPEAAGTSSQAWGWLGGGGVGGGQGAGTAGGATRPTQRGGGAGPASRVLH